jgi:8-oxo-dGTP diphosphatase
MVNNKEIIEVCDIFLMNGENKFLMQLRDNKESIYGSNKWGVLGGGKNKNETSEECILREIKEELEIELKKPRLVDIVEDQNKNKLFRHYIFLDFIDKKASEFKLNEGERLEFYGPEDLKLLNKVEWLNDVYLNILKKICRLEKQRPKIFLR